MERWKWIPGYEDRYEVSDQGRVRSWITGGVYGSRKMHEPRPLRASTSKRGYLTVGLRDESGHNRTRKVHQLVLEAFIGPRSIGTGGLHADDDPTNNVLTNLRWGDQAENTADSVRNGTRRTGWSDRTHCSHGHEYTEKTTRWAGNVRYCRRCAADRMAASRKRVRV